MGMDYQLFLPDIKFIRLIDNNVKKGIFFKTDPMYHHTNRYNQLPHVILYYLAAQYLYF